MLLRQIRLSLTPMSALMRLDKIAQAAMKNAQNGKDIKKATVNGSYEIYTVKLSDTWNSVSDLKNEAKKAHAAFAAANPVVKSSKVSVGIEVDKVEKDNYVSRC